MWSECLLQKATDFGFPVSGLVDFELAKPEYTLHADRYAAWVADGRQGEMGYLTRGLDFRRNPEKLFPKLQSVFTVLSPYSAKPFGEIDPTKGVRYARYLRGADYHVNIKDRMTALLSAVAKEHPELEFKVCVDTSAVLERAWAELTGLGWIGKNTLLIHPKLGSYTFIGVAFLNLKSGRAPLSHANFCGSCDRCLPACPTEAITLVPSGKLSSETRPENRMDARKCISYQTLERRGPDNGMMAKSAWVAGCDLCQEACPFNQKRTKLETQFSEKEEDLERFPATFDSLKKETEAEYRARVRLSALSRIRPEDFKRNLDQCFKYAEPFANR